MLFAPVSYSLQAPLQAFSHRLDVDRERSSAVSRCDVCETEKVERLWRLSARSLRFPHRRPAKLDERGLLGMEREPVFLEVYYPLFLKKLAQSMGFPSKNY